MKKEIISNNGISTIHIGFAVDNGYVKYMAVTIASILKNTQNEVSLCFHVINDGYISTENIDKIDKLHNIREFTIIWYPMNRQMHHEQRQDTRQDIPMVINYRLLMASILKDVDKIIFLDADLIVVGNLIELWNTNVFDYYVASTPTSDFSLHNYKQSLGIPNDFEYCNTGVMLVNLQKWRNENVEEKLLETEKKYRGIYKFYDQCVVNAALFNKILYVGQEWNFRPLIWENKRKLKNKHHKAFASPQIIHWAIPIKPWKDSTIRYAAEYYRYAKLTPYYETIKSQIPPLYKIMFRKVAVVYHRMYKAIRNPKLILNKLR
jgi:lipopolysaccharide biosynthesis glycosyltransferase